MAIYLLVKEHVDTGLKYLCKHVASSFSECEKYKGSGTYWKRHLKIHGNNVKTTCLFVTEDKKQFREVAKKYSKEYDVVDSEQWANLCDEEGQGGNTVLDVKKHGLKTKKALHKPEVRKKHLKFLIEHIEKIRPKANAAAKEKMTGVPKTENHKQKLRGKRPHVNQSGGKNNNAKPIITPYGKFNSIREASQFLTDYTYNMIYYRLQTNKEWKYIE